MSGEARIPQDRLNQIAQRKLSALGLDCKLPRDQSPLCGELGFKDPPLLHPLTKKRIERAQFVIVGHDRLRVVDPPAFEGTEEIAFYEAPDLKALTAMIARVLDKRAAEMQAAAAMLRLLKIDPRIDQEQLTVTAMLDTGLAQFEVSGRSAQQLAVTRMTSAGGGAQFVDPEQGSFDLGEFKDKTDLELHLSEMAESLLGHAEPSALVRPAPPAARPEPPAPAPSAGPPTLGELALKFGAEARLGGSYAVIRELAVGGARRKFVATHAGGRSFHGKVESASGKERAETFDLDRFPGVEAFAAALVGLEMDAPAKPPGTRNEYMSPARPTPAAEPRMPPGTRNARMPPGTRNEYMSPAMPGEIWVMNVVVEREDGEEIRYVPVDVDGKPFGAQRVLKKVDFDQVFSSAQGGGWRLRIRINTAADDSVTYDQLDSRGNPMGAQKQMRASVLALNFLPEAAAY